MTIPDFPLPDSASLSISHFQTTLDLKNLNKSYKTFWFWAIISLINKQQYKKDYSGIYSFDTKNIVKEMLVLAWVPVVSYRLNLGYKDQLGVIIEKIRDSLPGLKTNWDYYRIEAEVEKFLETHKSIYTSLLRFVPFRFLSPFYKNDLKEVSEKNKNNMLKEIANRKPEIYSFSSDGFIDMPENWFKYLSDNYSIIESWIKYKLVHYLERRNPGIPAISLKLDLSVQRNLTRQRKYWIEFMKTDKVFDIISGSRVKADNFHLDHYIPFSFLLHNQIWNLAPLDPSHNLEKSDILPDWDNTFDVFSDNQFRFYRWAQDKSRKTVLDEYLNVLKDTNISGYPDFASGLSGTLKPQWLAAYGMGYSSLSAV